MPTLPPDLPEETVDLYSKALEQPPLTRETLKEMVQNKLRQLKAVAQNSEQVDITLAEEVADGLLKLIEETPQSELSYVQAACAYFASNEDVLADLESIAGFDDDARVFNAVCGHLSRKDLEVV
ncbi:MAG TPA: hypothetical protein EYO33_14445 [Phycisphaerales bacterium]|nr:hypothetical protein [Phycisphaerales bacterium]